MHVRIGRLLTAAAGILAVAVATGTPAAAAPPAAPGSLPRPAADRTDLRGANAPIRGEVRGASGAAAATLAGDAATRFRTLRRSASALHTAWGTAFDQP